MIQPDHSNRFCHYLISYSAAFDFRNGTEQYSYAFSFASLFSSPFVPPLCVALIRENFIFKPAIFVLSPSGSCFSTVFLRVSNASYNTFISSQSSRLYLFLFSSTVFTNFL